jgi:hypothetical protein
MKYRIDKLSTQAKVLVESCESNSLKADHNDLNHSDEGIWILLQFKRFSETSVKQAQEFYLKNILESRHGKSQDN